MPRVIITEAVQVLGTVLTPGEQELDLVRIERLVANGRGHLVHLVEPVPEPSTGDDAPAGDDAKADSEALDAALKRIEQAIDATTIQPVAPAAPAGDLLAEFPELVAAGFTAASAAAATDAELLEVKGVGRATVRRLREALGQKEEA